MSDAPSTGRITAWRLAVRLPTLPAAVAPVLVGTGAAVGAGVFAPGPALAALLGALLLQIGANLANDLSDFHRGSDTAARVGPLRVTQAGLLTEREVQIGAVLTFALATVCGLYLAFVAGWLVVAIGVASILAAVAYTGGPWPFGYHALGDLFVFVFFGLVATVGTYYVQSGGAPAVVWLAALPVGCSVTAILVVNNLRDIPTDAASGKNTLAVVMGDRLTRFWFAFLVLAALGAVPLPWLAGSSPAVLIGLGAVTLLLPPLRNVLRGDGGAALNLSLRQTARFHLALGLLLAVGLSLD